MAAVAELDYGTLQEVAKDGSMDYEKWPAILEPLLERLSQIVHSDFPIPTVPPSLESSNSLKTSAPGSPTQTRSEAAGQSISTRSPRSVPPVPLFPSSSASTTSNVPDSVPASQNNSNHDNNTTAGDVETIPAQLISQLTSIQNTLRSSFNNRPPHTIQRLAELVISPNRHYKTLPAWLRAVDRVVSVSSTADIFPLPHAQPLPNNVIDTGLVNGLINGDAGAHGNGLGGGGGGILWNNSIDRGLGSDESLGGALLTPIPWLVNRGDEDDTGSPDLSGMLNSDHNADGMVPEREDGAVTQGELIRMEQEAGIVPVGQNRGPNRGSENGEGLMDDESGDDITPHARGPDIVGVEDMGLQNGQGLELQLGRAAPETGSPTAQEKTEPTPQSEDGEGDVVLGDADAVAETDSTNPSNPQAEAAATAAAEKTGTDSPITDDTKAS